MAEKEYIERGAAIESIRLTYCKECNSYNGVRCRACEFDDAMSMVEDVPAADVVEIDKVAEMLRLMFHDDCACDYNGNEEWLTEKCKYAETECPMPRERLGCWKEFVKHFLAKMDGGKTE